jgi:hypothetical protein
MGFYMIIGIVIFNFFLNGNNQCSNLHGNILIIFYHLIRWLQGNI